MSDDAERATDPVEIATVADLIDLDEALATIDINDPMPPRWAFRGQPREFKTLVPAFQRQFEKHSFGTAELIERRLIEAFRTHYAALNDLSPDMPTPDMLDARYDLRCLSAMAHYEIPTRLLDWTSDLWTAVYFACASDPDRNAELWYYDRQLFEHQRILDRQLASLLNASPRPPPEPPFLDRRGEDLIVELDPQITPRMKQQAAHHTVSTNVFADHVPLIRALQQDAADLAQLHEPSAPQPPSPRKRKERSTTPAQPEASPPQPCEPSAEGRSDGSAERLVLRRMVIGASCKGKALQFLAEHRNITASTIFPDVVGLGRFLRWQFESLRTMLM